MVVGAKHLEGYVCDDSRWDERPCRDGIDR